MYEPVEDGVPEGGVADHLVPVLDGQLAGHERNAPPGALLDEFEEIAPFAVAEGRQPQSSRMSRSVLASVCMSLP